MVHKVRRWDSGGHNSLLVVLPGLSPLLAVGSVFATTTLGGRH